MKTLQLHQNSLLKAVEFLAKDALVAFPTETVYGLGANIFSEKAIQEIYRVKRRPQDNPLIAHIATLADAEKLAEDLPSQFFQLAEAFFPGPLTLIVKRHARVPKIVSAGLNTIALRMPSHPIAKALLSACKHPLVAPSANLSGRPSSTTMEHVLQDFDGNIAAVISGGTCTYGIESTVIDLVSFDSPTLLRHGALQKEAIESVLGCKISVYTKGSKGSPIASPEIVFPGMKYRHYAPNLPVYVFSKEEDLKKHLEKGYKTLVISKETHTFFSLSFSAETLYANLRFAETHAYEDIAFFCSGNIEEVLQNRLEKIQGSFI